jgi:hypothetical protein
MDHNKHHKPQGVYQQMALTAFDDFTAIKTSEPPFSVVFTLWVSMIAALGVASLPSWRRTISRKAALSFFQVPSLR